MKYLRKVVTWKDLGMYSVIMITGLALAFLSYEAQAEGGPTTMVVSTKPSNQIIAIRNYADFDYCRADREFIISLVERLGTYIWVTCTPLVAK